MSEILLQKKLCRRLSMGLLIGRKKRYIVVCLFVVVVLCCVVGYLLIPRRSILAQHSGTQDEVFNKKSKEHYISFPTSDGETLSGWFVNRGIGATLVICYPGNCCNAGMFLKIAEQDTSRSYLMLNYRGYGESSGCLTEENMVDDACTALKYYVREYTPQSVSLLGFSLGTGVAIQVAARTPQVKKLILVAPFDSMIGLGDLDWVRKCLLRDHFYSVDYAPQVACPVYVIYSEEDKIVRPCKTKKLMAAFTSPPKVYQVRGSHTDVISRPMNQAYILEVLNQEKE